MCRHRTFMKWDETHVHRMRRVAGASNLDGLFSCAGRVRLMRKTQYGRSSTSAQLHFRRNAQHGDYVASKGGVLTFTALWQPNSAPKRSPPIRFARTDRHGGRANHAPQGLLRIRRNAAGHQGPGLPKDVVPAVAFLASEEAHWITGQALTSMRAWCAGNPSATAAQSRAP